jgi:hypothetical protein
MKKLIILTLLSAYIGVFAQIHVPFTSDQWRFETKDYTIEDYLGRPGIRLKNNRAFLTAASFKNGIIEYDMAFPQGRAFIGVMFRMTDDENGEEFYIRSHQAGNPDANQYSPVYNSLAAWQLYYGEGYGSPVQYVYDAWMHVKLVVSDNYLEVYIGDMETPILFSEMKRKPQKGYFCLRNFLGESHFANFTYTPLEQVPLKNAPKPKLPAAPGTITQWAVSDPVAENDLQAVTSLKAFRHDYRWKNVVTESTGILNLAGVSDWSKDKNSVFARIVVHSQEDQIKKFVFGFSDRARVYLNDDLLYSGSDDYRSRDYRFLGTMGYYDAVYLKLKKGANEIRIAVSETFGGWGIIGKFENPDGITVSK